MSINLVPSINAQSFILQNAAAALGDGNVMPIEGYATLVVSLTISATATVTFEVSPNGTNFFAIVGQSLLTNSLSSAPSSSGNFRINIAGYRFFRARISTFGSGTVTAIGYISEAPYVTMEDFFSYGGSDTIGTSTQMQSAGVFNLVFNGTNWTRQRTAAADTFSVTGLAAAGNMLFNGTTWDRARTASGDGLAGTGIPAAGLMGYNGTTWDRIRVDASDNLNVNLNSSGVTLNVAVTGTPRAAIYDYLGTVSATVQTNAADGFTTAFNTLYTSNIPYIYNNSTFDRARSAYNDGIAATGIAASGLMAWTGAAFDRVRMGNVDTYTFGVLGAQPMLWNGSVYERARTGVTDGATIGIQSSAAYLFNGTSWDRPRSAAVGDIASTFGYGLEAGVQYGFNGNGYDRIRSNNQIFYQEYILFTAGQSLAIWDPGAGKKFRLQSVMFGSSTASFITLRDGSSGASFNNIMSFNIGGRDTVSHQLGPNGYLSIIAGNKLWAFNAGNATTPIWFTFTGNFE